ncbi:MAG: glycosyl hydrolase [bacterium]
MLYFRFDLRSTLAAITLQILFSFFSVEVCAGNSLAELKAGFLEPPMDCRPHTYWWWPGNAVTKEEITWELEQMYEKGIGGVLITSAAPSVYEKGNIPYLSDEYLEMLTHAIRTAKRLNMDVYINFSAGWVFGGFWVPPEEGSQSLLPANIELEGPQTFSGALPTFSKASDHRGEIHVENIPDTHKLVAVIAGRVINNTLDESTLIELTSKVEGNKLTWSVPEGTWRLMVFWLGYTGQRSYEDHRCVDHFNPTAMKRYCDFLGGKFCQAFGEELGKTVKAFHCDSFELANLPNGIYWSDSLLDEFHTYHGYDLAKYLPAIWYEVDDISPKIRYDVSEILHHVGLDVFFKTFLNWCEEHNVQGSMEPIGFPTDVLESAGLAHLPMFEITPGEKDAVPWFDTRIGPKKYISSGAHLYGRNIVAVEAYTYIHWELYRTTLEELKIASDVFFRAGANKFYNHGYSYSPERDVAPSRSIPFAARISHPNVWWEYYPLLAEYVARCSYLLRQGHFAPDITVYSPLANQWTLSVLNARKWTRDFDWGELGNLLIANGYDFDLLNDDILQNHAVISEGQIHVRDLEYKILILPNIHALPLETMRFIQQYAREGGIVIALERIPDKSVGFKDYAVKDREVQTIAGEMFKTPRFGDGYAYQINKVMDRSNVLDRQSSALDPFLNCIRKHLPPDFGIDFAAEGIRENAGLTFVHRKSEDRDIYFVTNIQDRPSNLPVTFRVKDRLPWKWDPCNGEVSRIVHYQENTNGTTIPMRLAPYQSTFVIFSEGEEGGHVVYSDFDEIVQLTEKTIEAVAVENGNHSVTLVRNGQEFNRSANIDSVPSPLLIDNPWKLTLEGRDFPRIEMELTQLTSWTEDPATKHFSGMGIYEVYFEIPDMYISDDINLLLDLGKVGNIADVLVNGQYAGTCWMRGQTLDITNIIQSGVNQLVVLVTNTLINRVSAFKSPPPVPEELIAHYGRGTTPYSAGTQGPIGFKPLPASGLMGPVRIIPRKRVRIQVP